MGGAIMLHAFLHHFGQLVVGAAAGVVLGGFFPPYAIVAAKWVAAQYRRVVH